jgi:hypothetical protein
MKEDQSCEAVSVSESLFVSPESQRSLNHIFTQQMKIQATSVECGSCVWSSAGEAVSAAVLVEMSLLERLPRELFNLLLSYLTFSEIVNFDYAVLNRCLRSLYLNSVFKSFLNLFS